MKQTDNSFITNAALALLGSVLCYAFAIVTKSAVIVDGSYLPYGNDAFYHAHRILEILRIGGLQEFDPQMHVPEGSWLTWPWGYDWLLAIFLRIALWFSPAADPMSILIYAPVVWIPVNVCLLTGIFSAIQLRPEFRALGVIGFALAPLTQRLHGIGAIDHHFMELTFVLLVSLLLLRWMANPASRLTAIFLGLALGLAQTFHHALFILQLPVLATVLLIWLRGAQPPAASVRALALALCVSTLLIALPSGPLRDGQFSMTTYSLFHPYVAFCSAVILLFVSSKDFSWKSLAVLGCIAVLLAIPVLSEVLYGTKFLSGGLLMLDQIIETTSPWGMITGNWGLAGTAAMYSWLILLTPVLLIAAGWIALTDNRPLHIAYGVLSVFGLALLLMQLRLNYFGAAFLLAGPFYFISRFSPVSSPQRLWVLLGSVAVFALAFRPVLSETLLRDRSIAGDHLYEVARPLFPALQAACAKEPGTVVAAPQFGHYIRFHTDCSVMVNNFLLTEQHFEKVRQVNAMFHMSVAELQAQAPDVRYVFGFLADTYAQRDGEVYLREMDDLRNRNPQLISQLMLTSEHEDGIQVLREVFLDPEAAQKIPLAGVYSISPSNP